MGIFSWLSSFVSGFDSPAAVAASKTKPKAVRVDTTALPENVRASFSALKDFEQLFVENKCYTVTKIFPKRDSWLQDFRALVVKLVNDPGSIDAKEMAGLESEAAKMERSMSNRLVKIPDGVNVYYLKDRMLGNAYEGMEGICVDRVSVVDGGKRVASLMLKLMDGEEITVLESEMGSGGGARSSMDSEEGSSGKEVGGDDADK